MISLNKCNYTDASIANIKETFKNNHQTGDGPFTRKCMDFLREKYQFQHTLLTPSGTAALEMMAMVLRLEPGDEIIMPTFTFVSSANAFAKFGGKPIFIDSLKDNPNMDADLIEAKITNRTRAILTVHYGGWTCDMEKVAALCKKYNLVFLEDAAQSIHHYYADTPLGLYGDLSAVSFHGTKIAGCGEGGMLIVNNEAYVKDAEIIREKGTNLADYYKGLTTYYEWQVKGSSYLLSDINAAYLLPQLENIEEMITARKALWLMYYHGLKDTAHVTKCPLQADRSNFYIFYIKFNDGKTMNYYRQCLKDKGISSAPHFKCLHSSPYYRTNYPELTAERYENAESFECILRLPLYHLLEPEKVAQIVEVINSVVPF
jgi:dTDP-4-amino-4,6-dideoxygalactose transaminase